MEHTRDKWTLKLANLPEQLQRDRPSRETRTGPAAASYLVHAQAIPCGKFPACIISGVKNMDRFSPDMYVHVFACVSKHTGTLRSRMKITHSWNASMFLHTFMHSPLYTHRQVCMHIHIYLFIYTCIHIYIYIYIYKQSMRITKCMQKALVVP
jgi:hypothetical protein